MDDPNKIYLLIRRAAVCCVYRTCYTYFARYILSKKMQNYFRTKPPNYCPFGSFSFRLELVLLFPTPTGSIHAIKQRKHLHKFSAFGPPPPLKRHRFSRPENHLLPPRNYQIYHKSFQGGRTTQSSSISKVTS
jgi:hypothetical protein